MANILDLDPFAFDAAMQELGLPEEDQARLREQYRQKNSPLSGVKDALAPEEGRNTSEFFPVSVPEGKSISEGVMSGDWDWAVPEAFSGGVTTALEGIEAPGQILSGVPYSQQEMQDAAWKTVGTAAGGAMTAPVPDGAIRMFGGPKAKNFPTSKANQSLRMQTLDKASPDIAWEDTGVEYLEGGRPVFQIDPKGASFKVDPKVVQQDLEGFFQNNPDAVTASTKIDRVLDFPELYDNYPELKGLDIVFDKDSDVYGQFNATDKALYLNYDLLKDPEEMRSVILHELQHGIQAIEGTSGGASSRYFLRLNKDTNSWESLSNDPELTPYANSLNDLKNEYWDLVDEFGEGNRWSEEVKNKYNNTKEEALRLAYNKYQTNSGEVEARAAQLWDQLTPEEKRSTKPSDIYREALGLLKKDSYGPNEMPTARIQSSFAEGGMVQGNNMQDDMTKLFAEGGLNTGDAEVDPISGNEVPPGSMPEEVRDDVDAKLSGGEYVVPADVLRYYGVSFFEKLRKKAKEGLAEMDSEGRIGGDDNGAGSPEQEEEEDDLPFGDDELMFEDEGEEMAFAEGGVVPPGGIKAFDPNQFYAGFSAFNAPAQPQAEVRTYVNAQGQTISIQFVNGQPTQPIPAGFYPQGQVPTTAQNTAQAPAPGGQSERPNADEQRSKTRENTDKGLDWGQGKDWANMTSEEALSLAESRLGAYDKAGKVASGIGALGGPAGLLGMAAGAAMNLRPHAEINGIEKTLRAMGNTTAADALSSWHDGKLSDAKLGVRTLEPLLASGTQVMKQLMTPATTASGPTRSVGTFTKSANPTVKGDNKDETRRRDSGSTMRVSADGKSATITKGPGPGKSAPAPSKSTPAKSTPSKSTPSKSEKQTQAGRAGFEKGGLVQRRKK